MNAKPLHVPLEAGNWSIQPTWARLDDVSDGVFDCPHTTPKLTDSGPFVVRSQDIRGRVFDMRSAGRVSEETYQERIARAEPGYGDLLYSREGTYFGIAAEVPRGQKVCLGQRMVLIRPDHTVLDHRFLLYWLNSPVMEAHLLGFRDGSVAERLNMATIRALPVPIIPISEQREIASILGALDDKIELNRKMAATLEEMARALYRSWFVDFDPVKAKAEGLPPAFMDEATAALFPDRFGEDGLPEGWNRYHTSEIVSFTKGRSYKSKELQPSSTALISLKSFQRGGGYRPDGLKAYTGVYKPAQVVQPGEIVISLTDVTQAAELIGRATFARSSSDFETLVASLDVGILRAHDEKRTPREFLHQVFNSEEFLTHALAHTSGTTVLHLAKEAIPSFLMLVPDQPVIEAFESLVAPMRADVFHLEHENQALASLRDNLLPKLMSGELRVGEARNQIEEVA